MLDAAPSDSVVSNCKKSKSLCENRVILHRHYRYVISQKAYLLVS